MTNRSETRKAVCFLLANSSRPLSPDEIAAATEIDRSEVRTHIRHMVTDGEIRNVSSNHLKSRYVMIESVAQKYRKASTPSRSFVNGSQREPLKSVGWGSVRESGMIALALPSKGLE